MSTHHCSEQSCLLQEDIPDEEGGASRREPGNTTTNSGNIGSDDAVITQSRRTTREDDGDLEHGGHKEYEDSLASIDLDGQSHTGPRGPRRVFASVFPSPSDEEIVKAYIPHHRVLPIVSGVTIPLCVLLDIPGLLTADWYIRTDSPIIDATRPNPPLLDVEIVLSILCAVLANVCLVLRFLERRVKTMTILCILFLSMHDIINTVALATFGVTKGDYTYSHAFWMTFCSTIVSMFTNVTLIIDLIRTPDFRRSGSGLTRTQRSLVIIIIGLFCYIVLGALANSLLLDLTFIDGLYFTVVAIATIGFGDIIPKSTSSRIFICCYTTLGVINLAFVIAYVRESVLEGLDFGYRRRLLAIQERRRAAHRRRRAEKRWKHAIIWRLREGDAPVWVPGKASNHQSVWSILVSCFWRAGWGIRSTARKGTYQSHGQHDMQLNLWALPPCQLEAAALEAGAPLDAFLPADFYDTYDQHPGHQALPSWFMVRPVYSRDDHPTQPPTHRWLGGVAAIFTKLSLAIYESGGNPIPSGDGIQRTPDGGLPGVALNSSGSLETKVGDCHADVEDTEKKAYYTRFSLSLLLLFIFWMGGAALFKATEGWTYGLAIYFCFVSFSAMGYGDLVPTTPAGRSIFVVWALIGVAIMTIFISVVSEAYTTRYKGIVARNSLKHVVRQYRERDKIQLSEKVPCIGTSTGVGLVSQDTFEREEMGRVEDELRRASATTDDGTILPVASTSEHDRDVQHAQRSLEELSRQILIETRSIRQYMQLVGDFDWHSAHADKFVDESVWSLIGDVIGGRRLAEGGKKDILGDGESRQTLMVLGIERSLKTLVGISEQAIVAIQGRDRIVATLERVKNPEQVEEVPHSIVVLERISTDRR